MIDVLQPYLELENAVLNGVSDGKSCNMHRPRLSNAVGSVNGLLLSRWVPPEVKEDDV